MGKVFGSLKPGWLIGAAVAGFLTFVSILGAGLCLASGNLAGFAGSLAWALGGYWFTRGMFERARPPAS